MFVSATYTFNMTVSDPALANEFLEKLHVKTEDQDQFDFSFLNPAPDGLINLMEDDQRALIHFYLTLIDPDTPVFSAYVKKATMAEMQRYISRFIPEYRPLQASALLNIMRDLSRKNRVLLVPAESQAVLDLSPDSLSNADVIRMAAMALANLENYGTCDASLWRQLHWNLEIGAPVLDFKNVVTCAPPNRFSEDGYVADWKAPLFQEPKIQWDKKTGHMEIVIQSKMPETDLTKIQKKYAETMYSTLTHVGFRNWNNEFWDNLGLWGMSSVELKIEEVHVHHKKDDLNLKKTTEIRSFVSDENMKYPNVVMTQEERLINEADWHLISESPCRHLYSGEIVE